MVQIAERKNILLGKIFAESKLAVEPKGEFKFLAWVYHVAPIVSVKYPNGQSELLVLDPSLFDHPVGIKEWKRKMKYKNYQICSETFPQKCESFVPRIDRVYFGNRFQYWPLIEDVEILKYSTEYDPKHIDDMNSKLAEHLKLEDKSIRYKATVKGVKPSTSGLTIEGEK